MKYTLKKYQTKIFKDPARFISVSAGRRFGKTTLAVYWVAKELSRRNSDVIYVAPTTDHAIRLFWNPVFSLLQDLKWISDVSKRTPRTISLRNGSTLTIFGAHKYDRIRGGGYTAAVVDEVKDAPPELWTEVIRPALSDKLGRALLIGTPDGLGTWFYDLHTSNYVSAHTYTTAQGGYVAADEIEAARRMLDERTFRQEYEGEFVAYSALAYYTFSNENISNAGFNPELTTTLCFDFNVSPMSCIVAQSPANHFVVKEFILKNSNTEETCLAVKKYLDSNGFKGELRLTGDYAGNQMRSSSSLSDWQIIRKYFPEGRQKIRPTRSVKDRVNALNSLFNNASGERRLFINEDCRVLIDDLRKVIWTESKFELDKSNKERTHASDALSYFAYNFYPTDYQEPKFG